MIRLVIFLGALLGFGCQSAEKGSSQPGRYLYFTSKFPSEFHWEVITDFRSTSNSPECQKISGITGKPVPATQAESHSLKISGDTLKVPLYYTKRSPCGFELINVAFQRGGDNCIMFHTLILVDDNGEDGHYGDHKLMPDTLGVTCVKNPDSGCYRCKEKDGDVNLGYRMPKAVSNHFSLTLEME